jgi:hypothetical protein
MIGLGGGIIGLALSYLTSFGLNKGYAHFAGQFSPGGVNAMSIIPPAACNRRRSICHVDRCYLRLSPGTAGHEPLGTGSDKE